MAQQIINVGTTPNDGTGDPLRSALQKVNANETELYAAVATKLTLKSNLLDISTNPNYPVGAIGDLYIIGTAGIIGGVNGKTLAVGDEFICIVTDLTGGDEPTVGTKWLSRKYKSNTPIKLTADQGNYAIDLGYKTGKTLIVSNNTAAVTWSLTNMNDNDEVLIEYTKSTAADSTHTFPAGSIIKGPNGPTVGLNQVFTTTGTTAQFLMGIKKIGAIFIILITQIKS
jgi:hypothetical protein